MAEGFLARWSQRKAESRRLPEPVPAAPPVQEAVAVAPAAVETAPARDERPKLELPDLESLGPSSDYSPFMRAEVPADLRRDALRRLWRSNPIISTPDGLDDPYVTGDFTDKAVAMAGLRTLYEVGRGIAEAAEALAGRTEDATSSDACPQSEAVLDSLEQEEPANGQPDDDTIGA
jgi:hypothetical protein